MLIAQSFILVFWVILMGCIGWQAVKTVANFMEMVLGI